MTNTLYIGVAEKDITPDKDVILGGATISGKIRVDYIKDPLYVRTVVVQANDRKICIVSLDLLMITRKYVEWIRDEAARRWGLERDAVMLHATQNHKSPALGHFKISEEYQGIPDELNWLRGGDERFHVYAMSQIMECISEAMDSRIPVQMGAGSGVEGRVAFNRRMVMRDGKVSMPSGGGPQNNRSRYLEGPIDPELGVVCFREASGSIKAMLLNYTCHPVHLLGEFFISADWPGALADQMKNSYGEHCIPLVLNGACGNINPWNPFVEKPNNDAGYTGKLLAETANKIMEHISYSNDIVLDWKMKRIPIPLRKIDDEELMKAKQYVRENPDPTWLNDLYVDDKWVYASGLIDLHEQIKRQPIYGYEIQVIRMGEVAWVGWPGEPFAETGLQLKMNSPTYPTYIVHNTQFAGYIPTKAAFPNGGYETITSNWSKFVPEAADMIVEATLEMMNELFAGSKSI